MTIMLEALSRALPDGAWLDRLEVSQGSVTFAGKAANAAALDRADRGLAAFHRRAVLRADHPRGGATQESFTITAKIVAGKELN